MDRLGTARFEDCICGMKQLVLQAQGLVIGYRHPRRSPKVLASGIDLALHTGELVCLLGPNGAGKSTLLRSLAGMQPLLAGQVLLMGEDVTTLRPQERARRLALVLTDRVDVGLLSVEGLVSLGRHPYTDWQGRLTEQDHAIIGWAIEAVGAGHLRGRSVRELSDGERQKIMIARALAQEPRLLILDEPTAFLDLPRRVEALQVLRQLTRQNERAILLSTHDLDLALRYADKIWLLSMGGTLQVGAPEDLVLEGALEATFRSEGVQFDPHSGAFKPQAEVGQAVQLSGNGTAAVWTARALERIGFNVVQDHQAPLRIEIHENGQRVTWQVWQNDEEYSCGSIAQLINLVNQ